MDFKAFCEELERVGGSYTAEELMKAVNPSYSSADEKHAKTKAEVVGTDLYKKVVFDVMEAASRGELSVYIDFPSTLLSDKVREVLQRDGYEVWYICNNNKEQPCTHQRFGIGLRGTGWQIGLKTK
jgi:hypothetical protein